MDMPKSQSTPEPVGAFPAATSCVALHPQGEVNAASTRGSESCLGIGRWTSQRGLGGGNSPPRQTFS